MSEYEEEVDYEEEEEMKEAIVERSDDSRKEVNVADGMEMEEVGDEDDGDSANDGGVNSIEDSSTVDEDGGEDDSDHDDSDETMVHSEAKEEESNKLVEAYHRKRSSEDGDGWLEELKNNRAMEVKLRKVTNPTPTEVYLVNLIYQRDVVAFVLMETASIERFLKDKLVIGDQKYEIPSFNWNVLQKKFVTQFKRENSIQEQVMGRMLSFGAADYCDGHPSFRLLTKFTLELEPEDYDEIYDIVVKYLDSQPLSEYGGCLVNVVREEVYLANMKEVEAIEFCLKVADVRKYDVSSRGGSSEGFGKRKFRN